MRLGSLLFRNASCLNRGQGLGPWSLTWVSRSKADTLPPSASPRRLPEASRNNYIRSDTPPLMLIYGVSDLQIPIVTAGEFVIAPPDWEMADQHDRARPREADVPTRWPGFPACPAGATVCPKNSPSGGSRSGLVWQTRAIV